MFKMIQIEQSHQTDPALIDALVLLDQCMFERNVARDEDEFLSILENKNNKLIVLTDSNGSQELMGGYCLYYYVQNKKTVHISSLCVATAQQGNNYGFCMLKCAVESVSNNNDCMIQLDCMPDKVRYYAKMGFEEYGKKAPGGYALIDGLPKGVSMQVSQTRFNEIARARSEEKKSLTGENCVEQSKPGMR